MKKYKKPSFYIAELKSSERVGACEPGDWEDFSDPGLFRSSDPNVHQCVWVEATNDISG